VGKVSRRQALKAAAVTGAAGAAAGVLTTRAEIQQAIADYQRTQFGGWPWPSDDPVHPRTEGRFARHADGRVERRG
jgi:TAT (twin-arginine translocation) pathway signal sequence